eukprot:scaffold1948_cov52-Attheya_sp.AAC.8
MFKTRQRTCWSQSCFIQSCFEFSLTRQYCTTTQTVPYPTYKSTSATLKTQIQRNPTSEIKERSDAVGKKITNIKALTTGDNEDNTSPGQLIWRTPE